MMRQLLILISILNIMELEAQTSNYKFSHMESTDAPKECIWHIWTDVSNWKNWDKGLKNAILPGDFVQGAKGILIPDRGPRTRFIVSEMVVGSSYTFKTKIPLGWLVVTRKLEVNKDKTLFTHEVEFTGILRKVWGNIMGKRYKAVLPEVMSEIKKIAEIRV